MAIWDNAAADSFFASLKNEMYYRQIFATRARARFAVAEYIARCWAGSWPHTCGPA